MAQKEDIERILLQESNKLKEYEHQLQQVIYKHKYALDYEEGVNKKLQDEIKNLHKSKVNATQELQLEMYNKFTTTDDIYKLRELSDQIDDSCCSTEALLAECTTYLDKYEENKVQAGKVLEQKNKDCTNMLKSQSDVINNLFQEINSCSELILEEELQSTIVLNKLKDEEGPQDKELKLLMNANQSLEDKCSEHKNTIETTNRKKVVLNNILSEKTNYVETVKAALEENNLKTNDQLQQLDEKISVAGKQLEDINLNIETSIKFIQELECQNEDLLKENIKLQYESKYIQEKSLELEAKMLNDKNEHLEKLEILKGELELLNNTLQSKEAVLLQEKKLEEAILNDREILNKNIEEKLMTNKTLEAKLVNLNTENSSLLEAINKEKDSIQTLNTEISKINENIICLKSTIRDLNTQISNEKTEDESKIENLKEEMKNAKIATEVKRKEIEAAKLKLETDIEAAIFQETETFNTEKIEIEKEVENSQNRICIITKEKQQMENNLDGKTLECDILSRKIQAAVGHREYLKEELKRKTRTEIPTVQRKRQADETSDSSYDGELSVFDRHLLKRKMRNSKIQAIKN